MKKISTNSRLSNPFAMLFVSLSFVVTIGSLFADKIVISFLLPVAMIGILFIIKYPEFAYLSIVALIPMNAFRFLSEAFPMLTVSKFMGIPLALLVIIRIILYRERFEIFKSKIFILLLLFIGVQIVTLTFTEWKIVVLDDIRRLFQTLIFIFLTVYFCSKYGFLNRLIAVFIYSLSFSSLISVAGSILSNSILSVSFTETENVRYTGTAVDPNYFAAMVLISLPLILYKIFTSPEIKVKIVYGILLIINLYSISLTFSRSVYLITFLIGIGLLFLTLKNIKIKYIFPLLLIFSVSLPILYKVFENIGAIDRIKTLSSFNLDPSLQRRATYLIVALDEFVKSPFLGTGPSSFKMLYSQSVFAPAFSRIPETYYRYAHNTYIEILIGSGIVGLLLFMVICVRTIISLTKIENISKSKINISYFLTLSFLAFMISLFFLSDLSHKYIWIFIGLAIFYETRKSTSKLSNQEAALVTF